MHATAAGAQGQPTRWWEEGMVGRGQREQNPQTPSNFRSPLKSGKGPEGPKNSSFMVHLDPSPVCKENQLFNTAFPIQHRKVQQASTGMHHKYEHRKNWGSGEFVPCHKEREWCGIITNRFSKVTHHECKFFCWARARPGPEGHEGLARPFRARLRPPGLKMFFLCFPCFFSVFGRVLFLP